MALLSLPHARPSLTSARRSWARLRAELSWRHVRANAPFVVFALGTLAAMAYFTAQLLRLP